MKRDEQDQEGFIGQPLPGTGGDIRRDDDVEGHGIKRDDADGFRRRDDADGLFRGGPTTQGEIIRRGPGDNPHGES